MTRDELFDLAEKAGLGFIRHASDKDVNKFEQLAALVASAERESLRESFRVVTAAEASAAILHEREACAKVCDDLDKMRGYSYADKCATAIRARGQA